MRHTDSTDTTGNRDRLDRVTVLVVDDDDAFRASLRELLSAHGLDVVGDAGDGKTALELIATLAPDVVLMDLHMPYLDGIETTRQLVESSPASAVVMLTVSSGEADVLEALLVGARGYLLKGSTPDALVAGIQAAARGESLLSAGVASALLSRLRSERDGAVADVSAMEFLSPRELEILRLIATGRHNEDIAEQLHISPFTVRNHISNVLRKLHLENRTQAAAYAIRNRL
jgi:NarL family two-component system response regulator LiaR